jgi:DNA-directed RNA polymerase subunit RPC12/RpoP
MVFVEYVCPHCDGSFDAADGVVEQGVCCPHCGQMLTIPPPAEAGPEPDQKPELDAGRIQQVSRLRTAAMRSRSYCLIGCGAFVIAAIDLVWRAARRLVEDQDLLRPTAYLLAATILEWLAWRMWSKSKTISRELRQMLSADPSTKPDFAGLSDGSQVVENLQQLER